MVGLLLVTQNLLNPTTHPPSMCYILVIFDFHVSSDIPTLKTILTNKYTHFPLPRE